MCVAQRGQQQPQGSAADAAVKYSRGKQTAASARVAETRLTSERNSSNAERRLMLANWLPVNDSRSRQQRRAWRPKASSHTCIHACKCASGEPAAAAQLIVTYKVRPECHTHALR